MSLNQQKKIFFTSDLHIGHENVLKFDERPFKDLEQMHRVLIRNFNNTVPKDGVTYFLGDMGLTSKGKLKEIMEQLNGIKVLVRGNHDGNVFSMYNAGFDVVVDKLELTIAKRRVTVSHCPLLGIKREDTSNMKGSNYLENWHGERRHNYERFTFKNEGQYHLSGHIHSPKLGISVTKMKKQWDVGVCGNNYTPVSIRDVENWIFNTEKEWNTFTPIPDYEDYSINKYGEIISYKRYPTGKNIKQHVDKDGYLYVTLCKNSKMKKFKVHRLVAKVFNESKDEFLQINHKDGCKLNNHVSNLEWCTHTENQHHAWNNGLKVRKIKKKDLDIILELIEKGFTNKYISEQFLVDPSTISHIRNKKLPKL